MRHVERKRLDRRKNLIKMGLMFQAKFSTPLPDSQVRCNLCPHRCILTEGKVGLCGARVNKNGILMSRNYGKLSALSLDPIEKKPLHHYHPGESILSVGTVGCNLRCPFCQNDSLSRYYDSPKSLFELSTLSPSEMLNQVKKSGSFGLAYTYSEPVVWYEFVKECSQALASEGFKNILISNGFINPKPLKKLLPYIHAANIDLKAFSKSAYRKLGGSIKPVLDTIVSMKEHNIHVELTTLLVPGINLDTPELQKLFRWIVKLDPSIPLHLSRYFPHYHYSAPPTSIDIMQKTVDQARSVLNYVYLGNIAESSNTLCQKCGAVLVERDGYRTSIVHLQIRDKQTFCGVCGQKSDFTID